MLYVRASSLFIYLCIKEAEMGSSGGGRDGKKGRK